MSKSSSALRIFRSTCASNCTRWSGQSTRKSGTRPSATLETSDSFASELLVGDSFDLREELVGLTGVDNQARFLCLDPFDAHVLREGPAFARLERVAVRCRKHAVVRALVDHDANARVVDLLGGRDLRECESLRRLLSVARVVVRGNLGTRAAPRA